MYTGQIMKEEQANEVLWVHPRVYRADPQTGQLTYFISGSSPCIRGRHLQKLQLKISRRFIPVYTGQTLNFPKISATIKSPIPSQIPMVGSVCITFSECVFADNTFWSKSGRNSELSLPYIFHHNKMTGRISFSQIAIPSCVSDT